MELIWTLQNLDAAALLDILLIASLLFALSFLFRGTQAVPLLRGTLLVLAVMAILTIIPNLVAFRWLANIVLTGAAIAIPIIFQPELRRMVERLGRAGLSFRQQEGTDYEKVISDISVVAGRLAERRHGALIVLERNDPLDEFINTGILTDSHISPQLLLTIFYPKTELHDGAVIIRADRIVASAAVLPLSAAHGLAHRKVGTRHRAAMGMTEISDAIVVIVSEETGQISVANGGRLIRRLDSNRLVTILRAFFVEPEAEAGSGGVLEQMRTWYNRRLNGQQNSPPAKSSKTEASSSEASEAA